MIAWLKNLLAGRELAELIEARAKLRRWQRMTEVGIRMLETEDAAALAALQVAMTNLRLPHDVWTSFDLELRARRQHEAVIDGAAAKWRAGLVPCNEGLPALHSVEPERNSYGFPCPCSHRRTGEAA
jgi:hypothetical protein